MKTAIASNVCEPLLEGSSTDSPVSPALQNNSVTVSVPAANKAADKAADNYRIKQVKAVVTEIKKKRKGKPEITLWEVRVGSAISKIYFTPSGERELFTLVYWLDGKRKREVFPTKEKAVAAAKSANKELGKGDLGAADLTAPQRVACARALDLLAPLGVPIEAVASEYVQAKQKLKDVPLLRAVDYYMQRHPVNVVSKMVRVVADELIESKRVDKLSDRYILQLTYDMKRFCGRFCGDLGTVRGVDVDTWLRDLKVGPRTRNNLRASIQVLFNYGIARKYLPKDHDEIDSVPLAKDKGGEIEIFTPKELAELLAVASAEQLPFMAVSAFAGVRHAEIQRLDWANVNQAAGIIEIKAGAAKTASRRVIPILPNLAAWLKPHWQEAGPVCSFTNMVDQFRDMTRAVNQARRAAWAKAKGISAEALKQADERAATRRADERKKKSARRARGSVLPLGSETAAEEGWVPFAWKHNALRHSFISYRVAETQDVAKVSLEAGNSPQMIFKHYRELVQPKEAKAWFAIVPKS
jgi:integrase